MENDAREAIEAMQTGFQQLSALAVTYAFSVLGAVILLIAGYLIAGVIERALNSALGRIPGFDQTLAQFFARIGRYIVLALIVVMVLGQFGVQTASIIAAIGAVGLAVGLALQGTLQNIAAGMMLLVLRPFKVGEVIEVGDVKGTVEDVGLFATRVRSAEGVYVLSPNAELWDKPVVNFSRNGTRRTDVSVGIDYDGDIDLARRTLVDLAKRDPRVLQDPAPISFVGELGDNLVNVSLRYWTASENHDATRAALLQQAKLDFDAAGLGISPEERQAYD